MLKILPPSEKPRLKKFCPVREACLPVKKSPSRGKTATNSSLRNLFAKVQRVNDLQNVH